MSASTGPGWADEWSPGEKPPTREQMMGGLLTALDRMRLGEPERLSSMAQREMARMIDLLGRRTREADAEAMEIASSVDDRDRVDGHVTLADLMAGMIAAERAESPFAGVLGPDAPRAWEGGAGRLSRARQALIRTIREVAENIAAQTGSMTVSSQMLQAAALLGRDTEEGDAGALAIARGLPVDLAPESAGSLGDREGLTTWIELMIRTEKMDRALARVMADPDLDAGDIPVLRLDVLPGEAVQMINDGETRGRLA